MRSSFFRSFHRRPVSSGSESAINACILMSFGPDVECLTACIGGAAVEAVEACEVGTVGVPSPGSVILVARSSIHGSKQIHKTAFNLGKTPKVNMYSTRSVSTKRMLG